MTNAYYVNPDVCVRRVQDVWIVSNPRLRTHVELDAAAIAALASVTTAPEPRWIELLEAGEGADRTQRAIGRDGLIADHSALEAAPSAPPVTGADLFRLLTGRRVLVSNRAAALELARPLQSVLDRDSLGSFHERVGQYLLVDRRTRNPWQAWQDQKFTPDGRTLLDTPYRFLEAQFFSDYFTAERLSGSRVLDFGCGNGYFAGIFAERGARVTGLDSSAELLALAQRNQGGKGLIDFILSASFEASIQQLHRWPAASFDLIYLQDTLLLLLKPEAGQPSPLLGDLLTGFRRVLAPGGRLCAMEPNAIFWTAGRYGDQESPYAVVTEYRRPVFNVAPTLDQVLDATAAAGFALRRLMHPAPAASAGANGYYAEFPIWDFLEFVPLPA